jgi:hypothetical protein
VVVLDVLDPEAQKLAEAEAGVGQRPHHQLVALGQGGVLQAADLVPAEHRDELLGELRHLRLGLRALPSLSHHRRKLLMLPRYDCTEAGDRPESSSSALSRSRNRWVIFDALSMPSRSHAGSSSL